MINSRFNKHSNNAMSMYYTVLYTCVLYCIVHVIAASYNINYFDMSNTSYM